MQIKGLVALNKEIKHTQNIFGAISVVEGQVLDVLDRNDSGDCLCLLPSKDNLIHVDNRDIVVFVPNPNLDPLDLLNSLLKQVKTA